MNPVAVGNTGEVVRSQEGFEFRHGVGAGFVQSAQIFYKRIDPGEHLHACAAAGLDDAFDAGVGDAGVMKGADGNQQGAYAG